MFEARDASVAMMRTQMRHTAWATSCWTWSGGGRRGNVGRLRCARRGDKIRLRACLGAGGADTGGSRGEEVNVTAIAAVLERKREIRKILEQTAPLVVDEGWGAFVRWREPLLASDVKIDTPYLPTFCGRWQANFILTFSHVLTAWGTLHGSVHDVQVANPRSDVLTLVYEVRIPVERPGIDMKMAGIKVAQRKEEAEFCGVHVRAVLCFDSYGRISKWSETWSRALEDVLDEVWRLQELENEIMGRKLAAPAGTQAVVYGDEIRLEGDALTAFRERVGGLQRFLTEKYAQVCVLGGEMSMEMMEKMTAEYFADDGAYT